MVTKRVFAPSGLIGFNGFVLASGQFTPFVERFLDSGHGINKRRFLGFLGFGEQIGHGEATHGYRVIRVQPLLRDVRREILFDRFRVQYFNGFDHVTENKSVTVDHHRELDIFVFPYAIGHDIEIEHFLARFRKRSVPSRSHGHS